MTILTWKFNKNFFVKISYKTSCVKLDAFSKRNGSLFFLKNERLRSENVNIENTLKWNKIGPMMTITKKFTEDAISKFYKQNT